ncbi:hypothetical protein [Bacterioplanoides sp.]|uniref:hypothetical protein n=1 Tax=Bacterioplanoides sp. TaxID=2066072 RepID=UPI003B00ED84
MSQNTFKILIASVLVLFAISSKAATYYVDPDNGKSEGDGSESNPWKSLQEVFDNGFVKATRWVAPYDDAKKAIETVNPDGFIVGGDTIYLLNGYHGQVQVNRLMNESSITIQAKEGHSPRLSSLNIISSSNWTVKGLDVSSSHGSTSSNRLLEAAGHNWTGPSSNVVFEENTVYSSPDISGWSQNDWLEKAKSGIYLDAFNSIARNNKVSGIRFGIAAISDNVLVEGNEILNFSGDGIRGLGNDSRYIGNFIANGFKVDDNHDDGFQSWTHDGTPVENVIVDGNRVFYNYNHPNLSLISDIQGIGNFDGFSKNWVVRNNLVVINHWNGISFYGAEDVEIYHNTVVDGDDDSTMIPRILVHDHKDGTPSEDIEIINNISRVSMASSDIKAKGNIEVDSKSALFLDHENHDYTPRINTLANNSGEPIYSGTTDINGRERACSPEIGAFEAGW